MNTNARAPLSAALLYDLVEALVVAAEETLRATARKLAPARRRARRGGTLRPGPQTPLWNEVVSAARPLLAKRGTQAHLARVLGVPRQRINDYFGRRTASPDAERVLLILCWLAARREGKDLS